MANRIDEEWRNYAERVIPAAAGVTQRMESRRAFYAGASSLFAIMDKFLSPGNVEPTDADMKLMRDLNAELDRFVSSVETGRA